MRNPWLIELRRDGRTVTRAYTSKREAVECATFALDVEQFESAELIRRSYRKSIAKYLIVDGTVQNAALRTRYPLRAKATLDMGQVSQFVDNGLMERGFTARQASAARKAIVGFWVQELKQSREVLTPIGRIRLEVQEIPPSKRSMARFESYLEAVSEAEQLCAAPPPVVAKPLSRFKKVFVLDRIPPEFEEQSQPDGSDHLSLKLEAEGKAG